jgi:Fe2+ or Zn2+ uptake regulation protein
MPSEERIRAEALEVFRAFLRDSGLNFSQPRAIVLRRALDFQHHFGAEELAVALSRGRDRVARGTVYRALKLLTKAGLIRRFHGPAGHRYEWARGRPACNHLICEECGRLIAFPAAQLPKALAEVCLANGFSRGTCRIELIGTCGSCKGPAPSHRPHPVT